MAEEEGTVPVTEFAFSSSVKTDVWVPDKGSAGYEWWYFDALSDNAREAIVVIFLDNFVFSPRYNALNRQRETNGRLSPGPFPAVAFCYYRDGKPVFRCINEYRADEFSADPEWPHCEIGESFFRYDKAPYGEGYEVEVRAPLRGGKKLHATFEWLSVESDLLQDEDEEHGAGHSWNLVAPRSDVTGKIIVEGPGEREHNEINFRGTGYHDHNRDARWLPDAVSRWSWGRAHFGDATAVFYDYLPLDGDAPVSSLFLVDDKTLTKHDVEIEVLAEKRDIFGLKFPSRLRMHTTGGTALEVERKCVLDSSFFYSRYLFEGTLTLDHGTPHTSCGIGEFLAPWKLRKGVFDRLIDMRIGRQGKSAFLK